MTAPADAEHAVPSPWHWLLLAVVLRPPPPPLYYANCGPLACPMPPLVGPPLPPDYVARRAGMDIFFLHDPYPYSHPTREADE